MDDGFSAEAVVAFLRRNLFLSGISIIGLVILVIGLSNIYLTQTSDSVVYETAEVFKTPVEKEDSPSIIMVDVSGAVAKPGVYELTSDARVQDVLTKAGGLAENADHQVIAQKMNLAARLVDGQKVYVPFIGETSVLGSSSDNSTDSTGTDTFNGVTGGLVNLNLASQSELEDLPGIGEVTAGKIIKGRPYGSIQDIKDKKIVGESVYGKIKDLVTVN